MIKDFFDTAKNIPSTFRTILLITVLFIPGLHGTYYYNHNEFLSLDLIKLLLIIGMRSLVFISFIYVLCVFMNGFYESEKEHESNNNDDKLKKNAYQTLSILIITFIQVLVLLKINSIICNWIDFRLFDFKIDIEAYFMYYYIVGVISTFLVTKNKRNKLDANSNRL